MCGLCTFECGVCMGGKGGRGVWGVLHCVLGGVDACWQCRFGGVGGPVGRFPIKCDRVYQ